MKCCDPGRILHFFFKYQKPKISGKISWNSYILGEIHNHFNTKDGNGLLNAHWSRQLLPQLMWCKIANEQLGLACKWSPFQATLDDTVQGDIQGNVSQTAAGKYIQIKFRMEERWVKKTTSMIVIHSGNRVTGQCG